MVAKLRTALLYESLVSIRYAATTDVLPVGLFLSSTPRLYVTPTAVSTISTHSVRKPISTYGVMLNNSSKKIVKLIFNQVLPIIPPKTLDGSWYLFVTKSKWMRCRRYWTGESRTKTKMLSYKHTWVKVEIIWIFREFDELYSLVLGHHKV